MRTGVSGDDGVMIAVICSIPLQFAKVTLAYCNDALAIWLFWRVRDAAHRMMLAALCAVAGAECMTASWLTG